MYHKCHYFVIDFETGGFSAQKNAATQIGVVVLDSELNVVEEYDTFIKPYDNKYYDERALNFTQTTMDLLEAGVTVDEVYLKLIELAKKYKSGRYATPVLVGHNWDAFDMPFLNYIFERKGDDVHKYFSKSTIDTMTISRLKWGHEDVENHKLETTCNRVGVELIGAHRALGDAKATANLFKAFSLMLREGVVGTIEEQQVEKFRDNFKF